MIGELSGDVSTVPPHCRINFNVEKLGNISSKGATTDCVM